MLRQSRLFWASLVAQRGKCVLDQSGIADPIGCGAGYSYVKVTAKSQKEDIPQVPTRLVTGTNTDLLNEPGLAIFGSFKMTCTLYQRAYNVKYDDGLKRLLKKMEKKLDRDAEKEKEKESKDEMNRKKILFRNILYVMNTIMLLLFICCIYPSLRPTHGLTS